MLFKIKAFKEESGQAIVLFALAFIVFCGFTAFAVDIGSFTHEKSQLQNAADAAALAGAQVLPDGDAEAVARQYAMLNGEAGDVITPVVSADKLHITVTIKRASPRYLSKVISSEETQELNAKAVASITKNETPVEMITTDTTDSGKPAHSVSGVIPIGVQEKTSFKYGELYTLKEGGGSAIYTGNYGAVALGGTGASTFETNLREGYKGVLTVGDKILTEPGVMAGANDAILDRIAADPDSNYTDGNPAAHLDEIEDDSPRLVTVIIVDTMDVNGRKEVTIVGFARFFLTSGAEKVSGKYKTTGIFLEKIVPNSTPGTGTDFGGHAPTTTTTTTTTYTTTYTLPQLTD